MNHKKVTSKRATFTKLEREYIKGIVYSLSFQRITDQEIVQWLHEEKQIDIDRSTISKMRNQVERKAEKWYIELRNSTFKYIAIYKERIDSLYSYQKILHGIIATTKKDEVKIRARPYEICTTCNKAKKAVYTDWNVHTLYLKFFYLLPSFFRLSKLLISYNKIFLFATLFWWDNFDEILFQAINLTTYTRGYCECQYFNQKHIFTCPISGIVTKNSIWQGAFNSSYGPSL